MRCADGADINDHTAVTLCEILPAFLTHSVHETECVDAKCLVQHFVGHVRDGGVVIHDNVLEKGSVLKNFPVLKPASEIEAGLFYSQLEPDKDAELATVGHLRMDFGHSGKEFWHTWWPHNGDRFNTDEFKDELQMIVDTLRQNGLLQDLASMRAYCARNGGVITKDGRCFGYVVDTEHYRYCLRCTPAPGEYQGYLYCYDLRQQQLSQQARLVGRVTYAGGEEQIFTDSQTYLDTIREELPYPK